MRIAVVADIHANLTALEAVVADLAQTSPDLVVHGGDLVTGCTRSAEVIDRVRELKWPGVYGNTDEMLWNPGRVREKLGAPQLAGIRDALVDRTIPATVEAIGPERLAWLKTLPLRWIMDDLSVVHAGANDAWQATKPDDSETAMRDVFGPLGSRRVIYGHLHIPFVRTFSDFTLVNTGGCSQSLDGDPRASYALLDGDRIEIRRVAYDWQTEVDLLMMSDDPFAKSTAATLQTGRYAR